MRSQPTVTWNPKTRRLTVEWQGETLFGGKIEGAEPSVEWRVESRPVEPVQLGYGHGPADAGGVPEGVAAESLVVTISASEPVTLKGLAHGGPDAFACAPEGGPEMVRGFVGESKSALNRGVYDRDGDWALYIDEPAACTVRQSGKAGFTLAATGTEIRLVLKWDFYRAHRGYFHWGPDKKLWRKPVAGWCSWAAHGRDVTEEQVLAAADLLERELLDYGYDIVQIDDGYQLLYQHDPKPLEPGQGVADFWTNSNEQFPHGMKWLALRIARRKLTPGIWVSSTLPLGLPDEWYVKSADGQPYRGPWVIYAVNGMIGEAVEAAFRKTIRGLKKQGWRYFKIDTIRHVLYDSYRQVPEYWKSRGENMEEAFRRIFQGIADEIGQSIYMLSCWGTIPEMAGIADGCRIGGDVGPNWGSATRSAYSSAKFNYLNNVLWLNDPDYMCFRLPVEQARSWASYVALTGMQLMVSDPAESYDEPRLDVLRKVGPPLSVRPAALRPIQPAPELWLLEIDKPWEHYSVLGRFAWDEDGLPARKIAFSELGLDPTCGYLVWDFWNEKLVGEFCGEFPAEKLAEGESRVYGIRPALGRPQVLATNRHIGMGAHELAEIRWEGEAPAEPVLSGRMKLPAGREFDVFIHIPDGYRLAEPETAHLRLEQKGRIARLTLENLRGGWVDFSVRFTTG